MKKIVITCFVALLALTAQAQVMKLNCTMGGDYNALYNPPDADSKSSSFPKKDRSDVWTYYMKYKPSGNGYHLNIPIRYCFINCFGEMYLWVTLVTKEVEYNGFYRYNGEDYLISEYYNGAPDPRPYLGKIRFKVAFGTAPSWGVSEVTGQEGGDKGAFDVFRKYTGGNLSLFQTQAEVTLSSVIDWDGFACLGQSYPMVDDKTHVSVSGMSNAELYAVIKYISVYKIEQLEVSCRDYTLEAAIKAKLDEKKLTQDYNKTMEDALAAYNAEDYQNALTLYQHASNLKPNEPLPKQRIQQCRDMIKKLKDEQDFKNYVSAGDAAAQVGDKRTARTNYKAALAIKDDPEVQAKLDALGADPVGDYLAQIEKMLLNGRRDLSEPEPANWYEAHGYRDRYDKYHSETNYLKSWYGTGSYELQSVSIKGDKIEIKYIIHLNHHSRYRNNDCLPSKDYYFESEYTVVFKLTDIESLNGYGGITFKNAIINKITTTDDNGECYENGQFEKKAGNERFKEFALTNKNDTRSFEELIRKAVTAAGGTLKN